MFNRNRVNVTVAVLLALSVIACSSFTKTAYQTLGTTATIVDTARQVYNSEFYDKGKVSPELDAQIDTVYKKYQLAMNTAITSVRMYQKLHDQGLPVSVEDINAGIVALENIVNELLTLFGKAGLPKSNPVVIEKVK